MLSEDFSKSIQALPTSLQKTISTIIKDEGYATCKIKIKRVDTGGGNFLGELYEIDINGHTTVGKKETNLFIKKKILLNKINFVSVHDLYLNEVFVYGDLEKVFTSLQDQANVPVQERFKMAKAYDITNNDAIILENLIKRNFRTYNRYEVIPLKYAELAIKELAKYHGLSFVIENKIPEYFNKKIKPLKNMFRYNEDWRELIRNIFKYVANMFKEDKVVKKKIENFLPVMLDKFPKYNNDKTSVRCTLTHGDYRMNNVLVKEEDGKPIEVCTIDYQLIDYGCPIRDFIYFIFTGSDQEFRRKNMENLKDLYFTSLTKFLHSFNLDVENVYPRSEFEKVYSEWLTYGLMMMMFCTVFLFSSDAGVDMQDIYLSDIPINFDERSQRLIREWIEDYIEWGYL